MGSARDDGKFEAEDGEEDVRVGANVQIVGKPLAGYPVSLERFMHMSIHQDDSNDTFAVMENERKHQ